MNVDPNAPGALPANLSTAGVNGLPAYQGGNALPRLLTLILINIAALFRGLARVVAVATMTRPADTTAYTIGDLVANNVTAGSVVALVLPLSRSKGGVGAIKRVILKKSGVVLTLASFRVHFYSIAPTVTNGDNGVWLSTEAGYLGSADLVIDKAFSNGAVGIGVPLIGTQILFDTAPGDQKVFALLEARAAYVPASGEIFTLSAEVEQA